MLAICSMDGWFAAANIGVADRYWERLEMVEMRKQAYNSTVHCQADLPARVVP